MALVSVVIPSRTDRYLHKTIDDLLAKAKGKVEIIAVFDGYMPTHFITHQRVKFAAYEDNVGMREAINTGMEIATGDYLMKTDEHCMFDEGWDVKLQSECADDWCVIPRRYRLNADKWEIIEDGRPPVDYMKIKNLDGYLRGEIWDKQSDWLIDDTPTFQGSCWFMSKALWDRIGPLDDANYGPFAQEAQEVGFKVLELGGRVVVNKKTWYAHWHRTTGHGFTPDEQREFNLSVRQGRAYCYKRWAPMLKERGWLAK